LRLSRLRRSIGSKIHVLTRRPDRPTIEHRAVSEVRATANRSRLRKCDGTCHGECDRENACFEFHCSNPSVSRRRTEMSEVGC